jgi:hypothetical protein
MKKASAAFAPDLPLPAPTAGRHSHKANKAMSACFTFHTLRLPSRLLKDFQERKSLLGV